MCIKKCSKAEGASHSGVREGSRLWEAEEGGGGALHSPKGIQMDLLIGV